MSVELQESQNPNPTSWEVWQLQIAELGGANPLRNFEANPVTQIDLTKAHPGGLSQFVAAAEVRLSNLVRDPLALSKANSAAHRIHAKAEQLKANFGVDSTYLACGLVSLSSGGYDLSMPILLWPISLLSVGEDFVISRTAAPLVNPELVDTFSEVFGVKIDQRKLLGQLHQDSDLVPLSVLEYLSDLGSDASSLEIKRVLAIGNYVIELASMKSLKSAATNSALSKLLSDQSQESSQVELPVWQVFDLDANQNQIIARALRGENFSVETLPGCGYSQTVAALLTNLALAGKRTLLVANRSLTINEISDRLNSAGLQGLIARSYHTWIDVISGISRNEKASPSELAAVEVRLSEVTADLAAYFEALHQPAGTQQVSILQCMRKLAELAAMPHAPTATARITDELKPRQHYDDQLVHLERLANLGFFENGPNQSAWFDAKFSSQSEIDQALAIANRLRTESFANLTEKLASFIEQAEFAAAESVTQWGEYLRLFVGLRETLDRLKPEVFDRPIDDLIEATSARKSQSELSGKTRRRLKKLAREFIRPGVSVSDVYAALVAAKHQRSLWNKFSTSLKPPMVPAGINDALVSYQALVNDLQLIQRHLRGEELLEFLPLELLAARLNSLCEQRQPLENYFEKSQLLAGLKQSGLEAVIQEFAKLNVAIEHLALEFDQVWWQTALEIALQAQPAFFESDSEKLESLEAQFAALDAARVKSSQVEAAHELSQHWTQALSKHASQVELFRSLLKSGRATLGELVSAAEDLTFAVSPVFAIPALRVASELPVELNFDVVLILDAAGSTVGENLWALNSASQVVCFGDPVISTANGFQTEPGEPVDLEQISAFADVAEKFGSEILRTNYRPNGQVLGEFINREFYQNRIRFEPAQDDYFGRSKVKLNLVVDGANAPTSEQNANESLDAEVVKAVELVFNHAIWHPDDSLLVVTASELHAERIRASIARGLKNRNDLQAWFDAHGAEKFEVSAMSTLRHRIADRIIFSIGFGKSQHGAALTNFGQLSKPDSRRALANLLVSARKELHIVSCYSAGELKNLNHGAAYLQHLLESAVTHRVELFDAEPDSMLQDLSLRLRKLGVTVKLGVGQQLAMVCSYGNQAMVLAPDWALAGSTWSEKLRQRPNLMRSLGWKYERIFAIELFSDPLTLAQKIATKLGMNVKNAGQQSFENVWAEESNESLKNETLESNDARLQADRPPHWG